MHHSGQCTEECAHLKGISLLWALIACLVTVLKVDSFERLLGPCMKVMKRNIENYEQQLMQLFGTSLDLSELRQGEDDSDDED